MYAQFSIENEAQEFTDSIHTFLCNNRPGYAAQTEKWSDVIVHKSGDLYAVPLPPEQIPGDYVIIDNIDGWIEVQSEI